MNYKAVYRTALATPGLVINVTMLEIPFKIGVYFALNEMVLIIAENFKSL